MVNVLLAANDTGGGTAGLVTVLLMLGVMAFLFRSMVKHLGKTRDHDWGEQASTKRRPRSTDVTPPGRDASA